jgi:Mg/Co/Ni transporter MgtE
VTQQLRERIDKWDYMKLKSFWTTKEILTRLKRQPTERDKIFTIYIWQGVNNQNIEGAQKANLPKSQWPNEEIVKWT